MRATLIDTGDFYGSGHNELLIREALAGHRRDNVVISVNRSGRSKSSSAMPISHRSSARFRPAPRRAIDTTLTR